MKRPRFITFTGVDEFTSPRAMCELALEYPVEWGILFSPKRQGAGRYPPKDFIVELVANHRLDFAAHLCGEHARSLITYAKCDVDGLVRDYFWRAQINTSDPHLPITSLGDWGRRHNVATIIQCRSEFPENETANIKWLFDASGGRGKEPNAWPRPRSQWQARTVFKGYAGGLRPDNVAKHVADIGEHDRNYWIDMESGVRDENDRFDLARCRAVCEAVYGRT